MTQDQKLAIIIPAYNEAMTIAQVIEAIPSHIPGISSTDVIVIDDASEDETAELAEAAGARVIKHLSNSGVGKAFHTGIEAALESGADVIVNIDSDGQFNPQDISKLLAPIQSGKAEFVTATRFAKKELIPDMPAIKIWGNKRMVNIIDFITGKSFTDVSCGFRAYTREAALRLTLFGHFTYTQESFIDLAFKNIAMAEVPLKIRGEREHGKSRVAHNLWRYALKSITIIFHAARDYRPFLFIGLPGLILILIGIGFGLFLTWHYIQAGQTSPYRSAMALSGIFIGTGFITIVAWMLADIMRRQRQVTDEILYLTRKQAYKKASR